MDLPVTTAVSASLITSGAGLYGFVKGIRPVWRRRQTRKAQERAIEQAKNDILLGRPEIPPNPITGEPAREKIPGLGERLEAMDARQEFIIGQIHADQKFQEQLDRLDIRVTAVEAHIAGTAPTPGQL